MKNIKKTVLLVFVAALSFGNAFGMMKPFVPILPEKVDPSSGSIIKVSMERCPLVELGFLYNARKNLALDKEQREQLLVKLEKEFNSLDQTKKDIVLSLRDDVKMMKRLEEVGHLGTLIVKATEASKEVKFNSFVRVYNVPLYPLGTIIHLAFISKRLLLIRTLLQVYNDVDLGYKNQFGCTPLEYYKNFWDELWGVDPKVNELLGILEEEEIEKKMEWGAKRKFLVDFVEKSGLKKRVEKRRKKEAKKNRKKKKRVRK